MWHINCTNIISGVYFTPQIEAVTVECDVATCYR
jgi:hypothetical protein